MMDDEARKRITIWASARDYIYLADGSPSVTSNLAMPAVQELHVKYTPLFADPIALPICTVYISHVESVANMVHKVIFWAGFGTDPSSSSMP
ncbi:hypothetical protein BUE80_DR013921 [Diplocarpon rosae]|nr:hypothetical protein BUE80_DR013921 [Diplocarpon rosae]